MKESVTKFDLEAAFKALDEIEIPKVKGKVIANKPALTEIFSRKTKLESLMEDYYDISNPAELDDAKEAREAEVAKAKLARIEKIVDLEAESPEDLLTSYVGKYIMQCPQCMTLFYKNPEDIVENENDPETVNVNEVCQHCGNETGYTLIGKVGEVTPEEAENYQSEEEDTVEIDVQGTDESAEDEELDFDLEGEDIDLEDIDLDLDIEDDEEPKEESFLPTGGQPLVEDVETGIEIVDDETGVLAEAADEADPFDTLLKSKEFKTPISHSKVLAMLNDSVKENLTEDIKRDAPDIEGFDYAVTDSFKDGEYEGETILYSKNGKDIVEIEFWGFEDPIAVSNNLYAPNLMQKVYDSFDEFASDLIYKTSQFDDLKDLSEGVLDDVKDKISSVLKKPLSDAETADWILENSLKDYEKEPKKENKLFTYFTAICFKNIDTDGYEYGEAPEWNSTKLIVEKGKAKKFKSFKGAAAYGKAESSKKENGPVLIYLANEANAEELVFLSMYFNGERQKDQDQINDYYTEVSKAISASKRYQKNLKTAQKFEIEQ